MKKSVNLQALNQAKFRKTEPKVQQNLGRNSPKIIRREKSIQTLFRETVCGNGFIKAKLVDLTGQVVGKAFLGLTNNL